MNGHKALELLGIIMLDKNGGSWHYGDYNGSQKRKIELWNDANMG